MHDPPNNSEARVEVRSTIDIVTARQEGRERALALGFSGTDVTLIAAAISEVARNILDHATAGQIIISEVINDRHRGLEVLAIDQGPGIADVKRAMQYGYSTSHGLGVGLPGVNQLMDEFKIEANSGGGTKVTLRKWLANEPTHVRKRQSD